MGEPREQRLQQLLEGLTREPPGRHPSYYLTEIAALWRGHEHPILWDEEPPLSATPEAVERVGRFLLDPEPDTRYLAARALGWALNGRQQAAPYLARGLGDPVSRVRAQSARSLCQLGGVAWEVLPELWAATRDPSWEVRAWSVRALRALGLFVPDPEG